MVGPAAAAKARIRDEMRSRREALDRGAVAAASELVTGLLRSLSAIASADRVASYRPIRGEIDLDGLAGSCGGLRAELSFPRVSGRRLEFVGGFRGVGGLEGQAFATGAFGIPEPTSGPVVALAEHDVVLVPLTAFDAGCQRVGQGGGFYDRALATAGRPVAIGIAYGFQQIAEVPADPWDVPLDAVATDSGLIAADPAAPWWRTPAEPRPDPPPIEPWNRQRPPPTESQNG